MNNRNKDSERKEGSGERGGIQEQEKSVLMRTEERQGNK